MDVELIKNDKKNMKFSFLMSKSTPAFANALRRTIIDNTPVMAIEDVEFRKNSSALYDEIIAHRLGLISLKTDLQTYNMISDCTCNGEGCAKCTVKLTLKAKGEKGTYIVYADELKSKDPKIVPVFPKTPIVKLLKNQELELEATAILGIGRDHMKFSPGMAYYSYEPKITVNNKSAELEKFKAKYPPQIFDKKGAIDEKKITELNLVDAVAGVNDNIVKVEFNSENFIFTVESWGQLEARDIVLIAAERLEKDVDKFIEKLG